MIQPGLPIIALYPDPATHIGLQLRRGDLANDAPRQAQTAIGRAVYLVLFRPLGQAPPLCRRKDPAFDPLDFHPRRQSQLGQLHATGPAQLDGQTAGDSGALQRAQMPLADPSRRLDQLRHFPVGRAAPEGDALFAAGRNHLVGVAQFYRQRLFAGNGLDPGLGAGQHRAIGLADGQDGRHHVGHVAGQQFVEIVHYGRDAVMVGEFARARAGLIDERYFAIRPLGIGAQIVVSPSTGAANHGDFALLLRHVTRLL